MFESTQPWLNKTLKLLSFEIFLCKIYYLKRCLNGRVKQELANCDIEYWSYNQIEPLTQNTLFGCATDLSTPFLSSIYVIFWAVS